MKKRLEILSVFMVMQILVISPAFGQDTRSQENRKARLEQEIALIDRQLRQNEKKSKTALSDLGLIQKKISNRKELVRESDRAIQEYTRNIIAKEKELSALKMRLDTLSLYYTKLVRNAYKNRDAKVWYLYILASENTSQAFRRFGYLKNLTAQVNLQAKKILETQEAVEKEKAALLVLQAEAQQMKSQHIRDVNALHSEEKAAQNVVYQLKRNKTRYQKDLKEKHRQVEALNREIERIIREATRGNSLKSGKSKTEIDYKLDAEFAKNKGKLPWPADGPVVEAFGQRYHPVFKNVKMPFNNGITLALAPGTRVKAVFDGIVKQIVVVPGYNKCILVQHGNYFSFYCKMGSVHVKAGDKIKTGDILGIVDTIEGETQLHLQIWKGTQPDNPENWLRP